MREDAAVADSAICVVCRYRRRHGDQDHGSGELFVCAQCQADAAQLFAIQDSIYGADQATPSGSKTE